MPNIQIEDSCQNGVLSYIITNLADSFPYALPYYILDDSAVVDTGSISLNTGQSTTISFVTDSLKMYQLVIAPGDSLYYTATGPRGCDSSTFSTQIHYLPHFPQAYQDIDCQTNIGSYDPNDKQAIPAGTGPNRHLVPNTPLEYTIRFQNTGTDTAFFVSIIDSLSSDFDASSLVLGAASHPFQFQFLPPTDSGLQIIHFFFDDILLPDSTTNLAASIGFVKFSIEMNKGLPLGTVIENKAAIYFDYNPPIITNTAFHTLHLPDTNICQVTFGTDDITTCGPYTWVDGVTYNSNNNTASFRMANANGCDSIVTLNLIINTPPTGVDQLTACDSLTWLDGNTYTASNHTATYRMVGGAANGCDSIVSLNLTINTPTTGIDQLTACDSLTWLDGNTYTASNNTATYRMRGGAANGCDSIVTLNLTINTPPTGVDQLTACDSLTWLDGNTYTASNNTATYRIVGGGANGCDSIINLDLSINSIENSVLDQSPTLVAQASNATYQWLDCDNSFVTISGATSQRFSPMVNGNYAVKVVGNGCVDTSACFAVTNVSLGQNDFGTALRIFPNPTDQDVQLDLGGIYTSVRIRLTNVLGQIVGQWQYPNLRETILSLPSEATATYFLEIHTAEGKTARIQLLKQ